MFSFLDVIIAAFLFLDIVDVVGVIFVIIFCYKFFEVIIFDEINFVIISPFLFW
jgi:hypothetical protein